MRKLRCLGIAAVLGAALTLTACGGEETPKVVAASTLDELYQAARNEGEILVYGPTEDLYRKVYDEFEAAYPGIEVRTSDIFGPELDSRLEGERISGGFDADLLHIGVSDIERFAETEYLVGFRPVQADGLPGAFRGEDDRWSVPSQHLYATVYNTGKLKENEAPRTWADLVAATWKGRMAVADPAVSGATAQTLSAGLAGRVIDERWLDALVGRVSPKTFPSVATALQTVATGEVALSLTAGYGTYMRQRAAGAPLGFAVMRDGGYMSDVAYGALGGSPHPNAARLLVSWMFSAEGQRALAEHVYEFGTMPGAPRPKGAAELGEFARIAYPGAERYEENLELFGDKF
ncbi:ABC transporter substrate-binding protein [Actinomadura sp. LOL_016]|uniref:ABC transporter substrate-binding protein n=1 Tax=unclassified Actinomadura TaxID=2626254 RepID=UPI003A806C07